MEIGSKLKSHRMTQNLTQEEVAEKLHVSRATISSWETGRTFPDIEKLIYLSDLYDLSLDQLIREEPIIMENIVKERKNLKRYKILKVVGIVLVILFALYNVYWFTTVYPKNKQLADWEHTEANNYLVKDGYTFQAHDIKYPMFLPNGNISVATFKGSKFDIKIDSDFAYIGVYDVPRNTLDIPKNTTVDAKFNRKEGIKSLEIIMGTMTKNELHTLIKANQQDFDNAYKTLEEVWKNVNGK